jgi:hypothetical protein
MEFGCPTAAAGTLDAERPTVDVYDVQVGNLVSDHLRRVETIFPFCPQ